MERDGRAVYGGILPETREALACLRSWYAEGIIDPEFLTDRYQQTIERKFQNGRIGYLYYTVSYWTFDVSEPKSMAGIMRQLNPQAVIAPGPFPSGPTGACGGRVWGSGGNIVAFGRHLEKDPAKVLRVLRIMDTVATDRDLYMATSRGLRGVHWDYRVPDTGEPDSGPAGGIVSLPPYDDANARARAVIGRFFNPCINPEFEDSLLPRRELEFRSTWNRTDWALTDLFGKPDVVPSASKYLADLRNRQMTVYAEIIRGSLPLSAFDEFTSEWLKRGGAQMTREANELLVAMEGIYRRVGVTP
jgi:putative aldouronate transport system substrate-binding protein